MSRSTEFPGGITNGADWYVLYGGLQDWQYVYNNGSFHITIELSEDKHPYASTLSGHWEDNREAMLCYMELIHQLGVKGTVTNVKGEPLYATISVSGIDRTVTTNPAHGDYYRLLVGPATYTITASAPGYVSQQHDVTISSAVQQVVNFKLRTA